MLCKAWWPDPRITLSRVWWDCYFTSGFSISIKPWTHVKCIGWTNIYRSCWRIIQWEASEISKAKIKAQTNIIGCLTSPTWKAWTIFILKKEKNLKSMDKCQSSAKWYEYLDQEREKSWFPITITSNTLICK